MVSKDQLEVMPAFWWMYNMYALKRNSAKYAQRDNRLHKVQKIEFDAFAPDTMEEIILARRLMQIWITKANLRKQGQSPDGISSDKLAEMGLNLLLNRPDEVKTLEVLGDQMEKSNRKVVLLKACQSWYAYGDMLFHYAMKNLIDFLENNPEATLGSMQVELQGERHSKWVNMGGQLMPEKEVDKLRADIGSGKLNSWHDIHDRYDKLWASYPRDKQKHAYAVLCELLGTDAITDEKWISALDREEEIQCYIADQVHVSREKDYDNIFRTDHVPGQGRNDGSHRHHRRQCLYRANQKRTWRFPSQRFSLKKKNDQPLIVRTAFFLPKMP